MLLPSTKMLRVREAQREAEEDQLAWLPEGSTEPEPEPEVDTVTLAPEGEMLTVAAAETLAWEALATELVPVALPEEDLDWEEEPLLDREAREAVPLLLACAEGEARERLAEAEPVPE